MPQFSAGTSARQSHQNAVSALSTTAWGYTDPSGIADIDCFLVTIGGAEAEFQKHFITVYGGGSAMNFGQFVGLVAQGQTVSFEVTKGTRTISVYGFNASNGSADCHSTDTPFDKSHFSYPYLIGSTSTSVNAGDNDITVNVSFSSATKMESSDIFNLATANVAYALVGYNTMEVVNLDTASTLRVFPIGGSVNTMAVDKIRRRIWSGESTQISIFDADSGTALGNNNTISNARSLKLAPDGSAMYALSYNGLSKIDPVTYTVITTLAVDTAGDQPVDLAISPDGTKAARLTFDGSIPHVDLIALSTMTQLSRVALTTTVASCAAQGNRVAFGPTGRLLVADTNCDSLHQIDIPTLTELTAQEVQLGRDAASGAGFLLFSNSLGKAVQSKEVMTSTYGGLAIIDPISTTFSPIDGFPVTTTTAGALSIDSNSAWIATYGFSGPTEAPVLSKLGIGTGVLSAPLVTFSTQGYPVNQIFITQE